MLKREIQRCSRGDYMRKFNNYKLWACIVFFVVTVAIVWILILVRHDETQAFLARYEITDLTVLGFTFVCALNDKGQVVGRDEQGRICIWDKTNGLSVINIPIDTECTVQAINNSGQIAGVFQTADRVGHAFIWDANRGLVDLGTLGGTILRVIAMNDSGQVIGRARKSNRKHYSFFWDIDSGMLDLSSVNNISINAQGINNAGTVVGVAFIGNKHVAVSWDKDNGVVRLASPKGLGCIADRISHSGKIAGTSGPHGNPLIWDDPNNFRYLDTIEKNVYHQVHSINDAGQILGFFERHGILFSRVCVFFFSEETGFIDLGESAFTNRRQLLWISKPVPPPCECEPEMNNQGQILRAVEGKDGQYHAILMTAKQKSKKD